MDKKTLTYITGFTAIIAIVLAIYVLNSLFIKQKGKEGDATIPQKQGEETTVKRTPSFTFSPQEPANPRPLITPGPIDPDKTPRLTQQALAEIKSDKFSPEIIEIETNDIVVWINKDNKTNRIVGKGWDSIPIKLEETYSQQFDTPGTFTYYLETNPDVIGKVIVK